MLLFIGLLDCLKAKKDYFNTSHVTVYLSSFFFSLSTFQNFNTSHVTVYQLHQTLHVPSYFISIHLMLLFIVLAPQMNHTEADFNTSHVTVYLWTVVDTFTISIHLMLLFIYSITHYQTGIAIFQYISCYCLSNELTPFYIFLRI